MDEPGAHAYLDLGPEDEEQLARLRRALILGAGFQINFLEVSHPRLAKEVLRRLRAWSGHDGVPPLAIVKTRPGRDPVAPLQHIPAGAVLVGIDRSFDAAGLGRELVTIDDSGPEARGDAPAEALVEQTTSSPSSQASRWKTSASQHDAQVARLWLERAGGAAEGAGEPA